MSRRPIHPSVSAVIQEQIELNEGMSVVASPDLNNKWHVEESGKRLSASMSKEKAEAERKRLLQTRKAKAEKSEGWGSRVQKLHQR